MKDAIARQLEASAAVKQDLRRDHLDTIAAMAEVLIATMRAGGCLYICGNGGSAADAQHIAGEFVGRFLRGLPTLGGESASGIAGPVIL